MKKHFTFLTWRFSAMVVLFIAISFAASAQTATIISGLIFNEEKQPVSFANVTLYNSKDSTLVTGSVSSAEGHFAIKVFTPNLHYLRVSAIGFDDVLISKIKIESEDAKMDLGIIYLRNSIKILEGVTVRSAGSDIRMEADKMVVNIEGTAMAAGNSALQVLAKTPGVLIDHNGDIQLNGRQGVRIFIDGRPTYLSAAQLNTMLDGMPAEDIKNLEVITNPSAKYDAEGSSGIININLKKNSTKGVNGSVHAGYEYNRYHGYSSGFNVNQKADKFSSFINAEYALRKRFRDMYMLRNFQEQEVHTEFDQLGYILSNRRNPSVKAGFDYDLNDQHQIGLSVMGASYGGDSQFSSETTITSQNPLANRFVRARNFADEPFNRYGINAHHTWKLDTMGTSLATDFDFVIMDNQVRASFINEYFMPGENTPFFFEQLSNHNPSRFNIISLKTDFTKSLGDRLKIELGLKASQVVSDNEIDFRVFDDEQWNTDPERSNHFVFEENIFAGYATLHTKFGEKWTAQFGLRAEQTISEGHSYTLNERNSRNYLDLFPSIFLKQALHEDYELIYNFSRRINRPMYWMLNPFVFYLDPYTSAVGNPYLRPQYANSFEITQVLKKNFNFTMGYVRTNDVFVEIPEQNDETKVTIFQNRNISHQDQVNFRLIAPLSFTPWWSINNTLSVFYAQFTMYEESQRFDNNQWSAMIQSNHTFTLPKKFKLEFNAYYNSALVYGMYRIDHMYWADLGIKRSLMKDQLDISMNVSDLFGTRLMTGGVHIQNQDTYMRQNNAFQSFRVSVRYRFSKGEKFESSKRKNGGPEEINRAGGQ